MIGAVASGAGFSFISVTRQSVSPFFLKPREDSRIA